MIKHPFGLEFNVAGYEFIEGIPTAHCDTFYADLIANVLDVANAEGFLPATDPTIRLVGDNSVASSLRECAELDRPAALLGDVKYR
jgi:hypothetical protein